MIRDRCEDIAHSDDGTIAPPRSSGRGGGTGAAEPCAGGAFAADTPKPGGTLKVGIGDFKTTDTLDPTLYSTYFQLFLFRQLRNNLIEFGPGGVLVPELAVSWEGSADAKTWVFRLREGVSFHDGREFTAEDAAYSLNLHRKEGTTSSAAPVLKPVTDIRATGKYELTVTLSDGNVGFPDLMTLESLCIVPNGETDFAKGIGTGRQIADQMEDWVASGASDGFMIAFPVLPDCLTSVTAEVIPELQRRGLFRTEYTGKTLRENLGLKRPANRHVAG